MVEIKVPDIGDLDEVEIVEVMVKAGDIIRRDQTLVMAESEKASMEIPSSHDGLVKELKVKIGDKIKEGTLLLILEETDGDTVLPSVAKEQSASPVPPSQTAIAQAPVVPPPVPHSAPAGAYIDMDCDTLVLGGGPGGYTAAFRAADLGQKVILVERYSVLGGVCLNVGCIPSKALLHAAKVITEAEEMSQYGIRMGKPVIELDTLRGWKESIVSKLNSGLAALARARKVQIVQGNGTFASSETIAVETKEGVKVVRFKNAIIATGSSAVHIPGFPHDHPGLVDSTGALELPKIPQKMLVIGGGIIGLEMGCVYDALGSKVTVVELAEGLVMAADRDVVQALQKRIEKRYDAIYLNTKVTRLEVQGDSLMASFEGANAPAEPQAFDMVLMAVGRRPNGKMLGADKAGVFVNEQGFIPGDKQQRTNVPHIFAIGDVCGEPMLAHKASAEGKIAAEVIAGHKVAFEALTIPSVAYTDPELAWMGVTESEAKAKGITYEKAAFPWSASGRAQTIGRDEGMTKLLWDPANQRIIGASIVGTNAGELLAEMVLALEMGADLEDLALTIHAHPTLSETTMLAAEMGLGSITDLFLPKKAG